MEKLYVFGTGNAQAVHCYNTCFALKDEDEFFMVDAGGGNGILKILEEMNVDLSHIHHIFVTHEHTDHILGIVWMIRMIAAAMKKMPIGDSFRSTAIRILPKLFPPLPPDIAGEILQHDRRTDFPCSCRGWRNRTHSGL